MERHCEDLKIDQNLRNQIEHSDIRLSNLVNTQKISVISEFWRVTTFHCDFDRGVVLEVKPRYDMFAPDDIATANFYVTMTGSDVFDNHYDTEMNVLWYLRLLLRFVAAENSLQQWLPVLLKPTKSFLRN